MSMAKKFKGDLYERTVNGQTQYRYAPASLAGSRVARQQWKNEGWEKSPGKPVGVSEKADKPKATKAEKPKEEQFETV